MQKENNKKGLSGELDNKEIEIQEQREQRAFIEKIVNSNRHERRRVGKLLKVKIPGVVMPYKVDTGKKQSLT